MKWFLYKRGTIQPHRVWPIMKAINRLGTKLNGIKIDRALYLNVGSQLWWGWDERQLRNLGKLLLSKLNTAGRQKQHFSLLQRLTDRAIRIAETVRRQNLAEIGNQQLIKLYRQLYNACEPAHALMNSDIDAIDFYPVEYLRQKIESQLPKNLNAKQRSDVLIKTTAPAHLSFVALEEIEIFKLAHLAKNQKLNKDAVTRKLNRILERFWWTSLGWESLNPKSFADLSKIYKSYYKQRNIKQRIRLLKRQPETIKAARLKLINKYRLNGEIRRLMSLFDRYAYYHDLRKEMQMRVVFSAHLLLLEVSRLFGIPVSDLEWLSYDEICDTLRGKKTNWQEFQRRKKAVCIFVDKGKIRIYPGKKALRIKNREIQQENNLDSEIKGVVAFPGLVRGIAKVCKGAPEAFSKVKKGDVLVCGMTLPDYAPVMRLAAAIVTDEGGITSHAAIVSRELGIPCIIGTKIATEVLKDGDLVEVNANHGWVRKIK